MLTKKQLEDASACRQHNECCTEPNRRCALSQNGEVCDYPQIEQLAQTALACRTMLEKVEWSGEFGGIGHCPICFSSEKQGHAKDCELGKLLKGEPIC